MKLLFIGNSYTYYHDMPALLENLLRENGYPAEVFSVTNGGRKLIENTSAQDEYTLQLEQLLQNHTFDAVFLQEQSFLSILNYPLFLDGVTALAEKLAPYATQIILYVTWGRKDGSPDLEKHSLSRLSMTRKISDAYIRAASQIHAEISPVGKAFADAYEKYELYAEDFSHPSYTGSCLAALVHYTVVTGNAPQKYRSLQLSPEIVVELKEIALRCVSSKTD